MVAEGIGETGTRQPFDLHGLHCFASPVGDDVGVNSQKVDVDAAQGYIALVKVVSPLEPDSPSQEGLATRQKAWQARLPFFYGWFVVGAGFFSFGVSSTAWQSFSVFFVALIQEFGWSRAPAAGVFSLFVIVTGLAGACAGFLCDRYGPGRVAWPSH